MAIDAPAVNESIWDVATDKGPTYTALVIWDGQAYSALCRELDIASSGDTAVEAFFLLKSAVREALAVAAEKHIAAGTAVTNADLASFMAMHKAQIPVSTYVFTA